MNEQKLQVLVQKVADKFIKQQRRLATAESCTGGWVSKIITDMAGSSQWFDCAIVTYSNQAKQDLLGVSEQLLREHGAVSEQTVRAMVEGLLERSQADVGISISGIAGPGGGTEQKPVGTVWIAWAVKADKTNSQCFRFSGDRNEIRKKAVAEALSILLRRVD